MNDIPDEWVTLAERKGVRPTMRGVAEAAGVPPTTMSRIIAGKNTRSENIESIAKALGVPTGRIYLTLNRPVPGDKWVPPEESQWLKPGEREAINQLIRSIAEGRDQVDEAKPGLRAVPDRKAARKGTIRAVEPSEAELPDPDADDMEPR